MKVILQERVANLGNVGAQVNVKAGYARNYLLPRKKALIATKENIVAFESKRAELEKKAAEVLANAQKRAELFAGFEIKVPALASEEGKLFGSVGPRDIANAMHSAGHSIEKSEVEMPEGPIRMLGEFMMTLHLHSEVSVKIKVIVVPIEKTH